MPQGLLTRFRSYLNDQEQAAKAEQARMNSAGPRIGPNKSRTLLDLLQDPTAPIRDWMRDASPNATDEYGNDRWLPSDVLGLISENLTGKGGATPGAPGAPGLASTPFHFNTDEAVRILGRRGVQSKDAKDWIQAIQRARDSDHLRGIMELSDPGLQAPMTSAAIRAMNYNRAGRGLPEAQLVQPVDRVHEFLAQLPWTSTRVSNARRALEAQGIGTDVARRAVPLKGTDAANFERALASINPVDQAVQAAGGARTLEDIIGGPYIDRGRMGLGGASPKRVLEGPTGDLWMHKGMPGQFAPGNDTTGIGVNMMMHPEISAQESAASRVASMLNEGRTPISHNVATGGTLQPIIDNELKHPTLRSIKPENWDPKVVTNLQFENPIDALLGNYDNHSNQFMQNKNTGELIAADKGLVELSRNRIFPANNAGAGRPYYEFNRGESLNSRYNPNAVQDFIQQVKMVPQSEFESSLAPYFHQSGMSDSDKAGFMRTWMRKVNELAPAYDDYYRRFIQP